MSSNASIGNEVPFKKILAVLLSIVLMLSMSNLQAFADASDQQSGKLASPAEGKASKNAPGGGAFIAVFQD